MLQLAYNSNGWRRFPLPETIAQLAQIGYSAVEVSCQPAHLKPFDWHDSDVQTIKRALADQSMTISNVHTGVKHLLSMQDYEPSLITSDGAGRKRRIDFLRACIDLTSALDVPFLAINTGFIRPEVPVAQAWAYLVAGMEECLEYAQRSNVRLLVEPEPEMFIETVRDFLALYEKMNRPPALGLNLDVGHAQWGYEDTPAIIRELSELIWHIHVEDIHDRVHKHLIPGSAEIDFAAIWDALRSVDYAGYVSVELFDHDADPHAAAVESLRFLSNLSRRASTLSAQESEVGG